MFAGPRYRTNLLVCLAGIVINVYCTPGLAMQLACSKNLPMYNVNCHIRIRAVLKFAFLVVLFFCFSGAVFRRVSFSGFGSTPLEVIPDLSY